MICTEIIQWFSPVGLVLDVIGAILIFNYGLPEEVSRTGAVYRIDEEEDADEKSKAKKYDKYSKCGFYLLILGFVLQFLASINSIIKY
jgi:hypothetical protein